MPSASSLFSAVFGFRKVVLEIFSELDATKTKVPIFPASTRSPKESRRGAAGGHTMPRRGPPWPRLDRVWAPWTPTDAALPPIYSVPRENPKDPSLHPRKVPQPPSSSTLVREGSEALPGTLPERGIITGGLYITMPASGLMRE